MSKIEDKNFVVEGYIMQKVRWYITADTEDYAREKAIKANYNELIPDEWEVVPDTVKVVGEEED